MENKCSQNKEIKPIPCKEQRGILLPCVFTFCVSFSIKIVHLITFNFSSRVDWEAQGSYYLPVSLTTDSRAF